MNQAINFEGGDKVGKHTSVLATTKTLLLSGYEVIFMDLPQYWNVGGLTHKVLRQHDLEIKDSYREVEIRCVVMALDRITSLIHLLPIIKKSPESIIVSDRGDKSNAVTIGYARSQGKIKEDEVPKIVKKFKYWDREYLKALEPKSILFTVGNNGKSALERGQKGDDIHEQLDAQIEASKVYKGHLHLPEVHTQESGKWRQPKSIVSDVLNMAEISFNKNITQEDIDAMDTQDILENKNLTIIGPHLVYPIIYGKEWGSLEKTFGTHLSNWSTAIIDGNKKALKIIEPKLAEITIDNIPKDIYFDIPKDIKEWYKQTYEEYPEMQKIITSLCSLDYWRYMEKFSKV